MPLAPIINLEVQASFYTNHNELITNILITTDTTTDIQYQVSDKGIISVGRQYLNQEDTPDHLKGACSSLEPEHTRTHQKRPRKGKIPNEVGTASLYHTVLYSYGLVFRCDRCTQPKKCKRYI